MSSTQCCVCVRQYTCSPLVELPHEKQQRNIYRHFKFRSNVASQLRTTLRDVRMSKLRIKEYINFAIMEGKHDWFPKSENRRDIVEFVKEVEKYPCLYDKTLPEYANKMHNRRAWTDIAKRANTSVPECRDRWRKIRISFMRSLKQQVSTKPPMRPYYLTEELRFLHPFLSIRPKTEIKDKEKLIDEKRMISIDGDPIKKHDISEDSLSSGSLEPDQLEHDIDISKIPETNKVTHNTNTIPHIINGNHHEDVRIEHGHGKRGCGRNSSYSDDIECNPRKMFLLSMLPDIEALTEPEMRIFRREVISTIDKIISDRRVSDSRIRRDSNSIY